MKILNTASKINNNLTNHQNINTQPNRVNKYENENSLNLKQTNKNKLRIPDNYESKRINLASNINKHERVYFEKMYPSHKNQIQAYLDQNQANKVEKGKYIDLRR